MKYDPLKVDLSVVCLKSVVLGAIIAVSGSFLMQGKAVDLNVYVISVAVFHLLEFVATCLWRPAQVDDDSFILGDYTLVLGNLASIGEWAIYRYFAVPEFGVLKVVGLIMVIIGQTFRTLAMYTAKESFNHYIQRTKEDSHVLVTHGIYNWSRHPSYFGFFWWFIGLRLLMNNWVILVAAGYQVWSFFSQRIPFEEEFLVKFFGTDYVQYRKRVRVWIPGI